MRLVLALTVAVMVPALAQANPDGAPWGAADDDQACAACHFDGEAIKDSPAISVSVSPLSGENIVYELVLRFEKEGVGMAGFLATSTDRSGAALGRFSSNGAGLETRGSEIRSTTPDRAADAAQWRFYWRPPQDWTAEDRAPNLRIAVNAANDDASPLGDAIHLRVVEIAPRPTGH